MDRGKINHRERARQLRDYRGLRFGNITPTDIDGFIDFGNRYFVVLEFKLKGLDSLRGQGLALERLVDNLTENGKPSIAIIGTHVHPVEEDINCANCLVDKYRYKGAWKLRPNPTTVREMIDLFLSSCGYEYPKETKEEGFVLTEEDYKKIDEMESPRAT